MSVYYSPFYLAKADVTTIGHVQPCEDGDIYDNGAILGSTNAFDVAFIITLPLVVIPAAN